MTWQQPGRTPAPELRREVLGRRRAPRPGGVRVRLLGPVEQRIQDPPGLLDRVLAGEVALVSPYCCIQQFLIRSWHALTIAAEFHVEIDWSQPRSVGLLGMQYPTRTRSGVDEQDDLVGIDVLVRRREAE